MSINPATHQALIVIEKSLNQVNWSFGVANFGSCPPKNVLKRGER